MYLVSSILGNSHCIYLNVSMFLMGQVLLIWYLGGRFLPVVVLVAMGDHLHNLLKFLAVFGWYLASLSTDEIPGLSFIIGMYFMCFWAFFSLGGALLGLLDPCERFCSVKDIRRPSHVFNKTFLAWKHL